MYWFIHLQQPGKLNLKAYSNVTDALSKLAVSGEVGVPPHLLTRGTTSSGAAQDEDDSNAPLATPESVEDLGSEYATVSWGTNSAWQ